MARSKPLLALLTAIAACSGEVDDPYIEEEHVPDEKAQALRLDVEVANAGPRYRFAGGGAFERPSAGGPVGPIGEGYAFEAHFVAPRGTHLSFATVLAAGATRVVLAPPPDGIPLWTADDKPNSGDITAKLGFWDVQLRPAAAPRALATIAKVSISHNGRYFSLKIENLAEGATFSPGIWAVHDPEARLSEIGVAQLLEQGGAARAAAVLATRVGVNVALSPGVYAVSPDRGLFFDLGRGDRGQGLERLAEDGVPDVLLATMLARGGMTSTGKVGTRPLMPGESVRFTVEARPGDRFFFATMYGTSNDWFYAPDPDGIELFIGDAPIEKEISTGFRLWDLGTEADGPIGTDPDQAPFQLLPNTGTPEHAAIENLPDPIRRLRVRVAREGGLGVPE